jgi:hypothetical protein
MNSLADGVFLYQVVGGQRCQGLVVEARLRYRFSGLDVLGVEELS